jgi:hypothetical protein
VVVHGSRACCVPALLQTNATHTHHQLLVGLDASQRDVDDVPLRVRRETLDERGLARPGGAVQQQPELVREAFHAELARLTGEVVQQLQQRVFLREEQAFERLLVAEPVPLIVDVGVGVWC